MPERKEDEFAFIKEKIKDKPLNKRRLLKFAVIMVPFAVAFGLIACFVMTLVQPHMQNLLYPKEESAVMIPRDALETETEIVETETESEKETETTVPVYNITEKQELEVTDYQQLQNKIYAIGKEANKSIVTVTGLSSGTDWLHASYESTAKASGIIIANNGQELLILTEKKVIADAQDIHVTFVDGTLAKASLRQYDGNTGIAVLSVALSEVAETTLATVKTAVLGNSYMVKAGNVVLAIGSPLGTNFSIAAGDITATTNSISTLDATYHVLNTDIVGNSSASGVLINLNGEVVGFIMQSFGREENQNTLTAVSVSELKGVIEKISNNQQIPYLGVNLNTVTQEMEEAFDLPKGVYVKSVEMDSPAMSAGLQSGDIIIAMQGTEITEVSDYTEKLMSLMPGDSINITIKRQGTDGYTKITCTATAGVLE
ncbi:MAG: S1C family serine protease [Roseburia sp.]